MKGRLGHLRVEVDYFGILTVTMMLLLDRSGSMGMALLACALHEGGHALAVRLRSGRIRSIRLCPWGIRMETQPGPPSAVTRALVSAAGPMANLLAAALFWRVHRSFAAMELGCGVFNLLPLEGMDGGDLLRIGLSLFLSPRAVEITEWALTVVLGLTGAAVGVWAVCRMRNPTLLLAALYLVGFSIWKKVRGREFCS